MGGCFHLLLRQSLLGIHTTYGTNVARPHVYTPELFLVSERFAYTNFQISLDYVVAYSVQSGTLIWSQRK